MKKNLNTVLILFSAIFAALLLIREARAQQSTPQFLVTWRANSYVPADYRGKIMPTTNSLINVSFELLVGGKPADISKQTVYWYLNDDLLAGGAGMQSIGFVPNGITDTASIRIQIPNYATNLLVDNIDIPLVSPEAVIYSPYPNGSFSGNSLQVSAIPYFFNTTTPSSLNYSWTVNDQSPTNLEDPSKLTVNLNPSTPPGSEFDVGLSINGTRNSSEAASANEILTFGR
ncbi:MAG: hypothetical protein KGJ89_01325 [Patescibacteria group bacterium]|nr:hypothetical protein [Patescibacteria group bacterium]MDE2015153.1 hypothetical protein [Patescibacteria group bacterium]MDE2226581.1 hypothetical protein [Patescibacteria group bacterium]